ncbi:MAG TPA: hypothetical protein VFN41_13865 [Candidatus Limnocylindrales bacterium]|nr:hypothetical protein [Candidatus Limnocylindrales bacterium]
MAVSDGLAKLSKRAKKAEDDAQAASTQARKDLEKTVDDMQMSAEAEAKKVQQRAQAASDQVSDTWRDVQKTWNAHVAKVRDDVHQQRAMFDASNASARADWAEQSAGMAVDYAYAAIEEAEYAVLDAILARREAEDALATASR